MCIQTFSFPQKMLRRSDRYVFLMRCWHQQPVADSVYRGVCVQVRSERRCLDNLQKGSSEEQYELGMYNCHPKATSSQVSVCLPARPKRWNRQCPLSAVYYETWREWAWTCCSSSHWHWQESCVGRISVPRYRTRWPDRYVSSCSAATDRKATRSGVWRLVASTEW